MEISVIIPTYKPSYYLYDLLLSIKNQDFCIKKFEVVVVLNGPKSDYEKKILEFLADNYREIPFQYFYSEWGNVSNARNIGLEHSNGKYIAFVDDDDILSSNYLSELYKYANEDTVCVSNTKNFKTAIDSAFDNYYTPKINNWKESDCSNIFKNRSFLSPVALKLIHKNIIGEKKYRTKFRNGQDSIFMFEISDNIKKIIVCKKAYYFIRERKGSASRTQTLKMRIKKMWDLSVIFTAIYFSNYKKYNLKFYISRIIASFLWVIRNR